MGDHLVDDRTLLEAHSTVAVHRPFAGAPWRKVCQHCRDSDCPALTHADGVLLTAQAVLREAVAVSGRRIT